MPKKQNPPKKNNHKRGRPPGIHTPIKEINYQLISVLARAQCPQLEIASFVDLSEEQLSRRKKTDADLNKALEGGFTVGKITGRRNMYNAMLDRYETICRECHKITISHDELYDECPKCGSDKVRHKHLLGNTAIIIFWAKNYLGMRDKVEFSGDEKNPLTIKNISGAEVDKKLLKLIPLLESSISKVEDEAK